LLDDEDATRVERRGGQVRGLVETALYELYA
jgi:hypothetical protein